MHVNQSGRATSSSSTLASTLGNRSSLHQVSRDSRYSRRNRPAPSTLHVFTATLAGIDLHLQNFITPESPPRQTTIHVHTTNQIVQRKHTPKTRVSPLQHCFYIFTKSHEPARIWTRNAVPRATTTNQIFTHHAQLHPCRKTQNQ